MNFNFTVNKRSNYFGRHTSPIDQRDYQNCRKSVYDIVYDLDTLSTTTNLKGVIYKSFFYGGGLRNQYGNM